VSNKTVDLTPERWAKVESIYHDAIELTEAEQRAFIAAACQDDNALAEYIFDLLQVEESQNSSLNSSIENTIVNAMGFAFGDQNTRRADVSGDRIGPYSIVRLLGEGGMGVVYLAERVDEHFDQRVAIKLGRQRLVDPMVEARLKSERQILANLDHPNIARLFDGGTTDEGVPYLVMEYIPGVQIDTYCDRNRLSIDERLVLFQTICSAVHYAHQNLVIHRDIKASNILVTDDGIPKLLDFGIAKLIDTHGTATDGLTREGMLVMTPENASPEQILDKPITTAADTYALGLLLNRLLTGLPTYALASPTPAEIARIVCHEVPKKPSVRIADELTRATRESDDEGKVSVADSAASRGLSVDRLQKRLRGDLDTIVLNALRKEPERRYRSVNQMADDIRLHLESKPITARAESWHYRTSKFVQRHYVGVAMSAISVAALAAFAVTLSIRNEQIAAERDRAREVSTFLEEIFMSPDPANTRGVDITAKEILAAGAERIRTDFEVGPDIQSALMETIGRVYLNLGEFSPSAEMLEGALALRVESLGEDNAEVARVKNELSEALIREANYDRAKTLLNESLSFHRKSQGDRSIAVARNLFNLAELNLAIGNLDEAETSAMESIEIYETFESEQAIELAGATNVLSRILQVRGDLDRTEEALRRSIAIVRNNEGDDHPLMAYYLQHLGVLLKSKGNLDEAEVTLNQAIDATRRTYGDRHHILADTLAIHGQLLHEKGDLSGAENALRDSLSLGREARGEHHPFVAYYMTSLAMVLHDLDELENAESMLRAALDIYGETLNDDHQYIASALTELGAVLNSLGKHNDAKATIERALRIRRQDYSDSDVLTAVTLAEYGDTLLYLGEHETAEGILEDSYLVLSKNAGRRYARTRAALARLYEVTGRPDAILELPVPATEIEAQ